MASDPFALAQTCEQTPPGLLAWWPGDGSVAELVSNRDALLFAGAGFSVGVVGQAFSVDGINDVIQIPHDSPFDFQPGSSITIAAWIHPTEIEIPDGFTTYSGPILAKGEDDGNRNWWFAIEGNGGSAGLGFAYSSLSGLVRYATHGRPVQAGVWTHVAVSHTFGDASSIGIVVDGELISGSWVSGTGSEPPLTNDFLPRIGGEEDQQANDRFAGFIDEPQIYVRRLSECEIRTTYLAGSAGQCKGDTDLDGVTDLHDNCPLVPNGQLDTDADGAGDECDCALSNPGLVAAPTEVVLLRAGGQGDKDRIDWCDQRGDNGSATTYDVCRGVTADLPVGSGPSETCLEEDTPAAWAIDLSLPLTGQVYWYLVRSRNDCGVGGYGNASDTSERQTDVCESGLVSGGVR